MISFLSKDLSEAVRAKSVLSAICTGEQRLEMIRMAYKSKGLRLNDAKRDGFVCIVASWDGRFFY